MSFKLSKDECKQRTDLMAKLSEMRNAFETAIETYNETIQEARGSVEESAQALNDALEEARSFVADIANQGESDYAEKSERWQESDKGQAAQEWWQAWQELESSLEPVEIDFPDGITVDVEDHADLLDNAPDEADMP